MDNRTKLTLSTIAEKIDIYKDEVTIRNYNNFQSFAIGGLLLSGIMALVSLISRGRLQFTQQYIILFFHFVVCNVYIYTFLKKHMQYALASLYIAMAPILGIGILMGTFLDPTCKAMTIMVLLCTLFMFITDKPMRIVTYIVGSAILFLACSYLCKPLDLFLGDLTNLVIYLSIGLGVNMLMLKDRVFSAENYVLAMRKADTDTLTALLNRGAGDSLTESLLRNGQVGTFFLIDIDDFKRVNDTYGHQTGDEAICTLAQQLKIVFSSHDVLWRLGGDEFAVFAVDLVDRAQCEARMKKLQNGLVCFTTGRSTPLRVNISLGCTICKTEGYDFEEVYKMSDDALYEAKLQGKNCFVIREPKAPQPRPETY